MYIYICTCIHVCVMKEGRKGGREGRKKGKEGGGGALVAGGKKIVPPSLLPFSLSPCT
jgi:hypothetical protein